MLVKVIVYTPFYSNNIDPLNSLLFQNFEAFPELRRWLQECPPSGGTKIGYVAEGQRRIIIHHPRLQLATIECTA